MLDWTTQFSHRTARMQASEIRELLKLLDDPNVLSFAGGIPDPELFPADAFRRAYREVLSDDGCDQALQYSVSEGFAPLRRWIVGYMATVGIECSLDNIMITSGSQQALDYLGKLFLSPGDTALVGWPTYLGALQAFNAYEPSYDRLEPFGNQSTEALQAQAKAKGGAVKFAYTTPDFANPTGETLSLEARARILDQAEALDCLVIEDAAYQALRFKGKSIDPILKLDIERSGNIDATRTVYCGSFSKTLSPGLRLGWVVAAKPVVQRLVLIKQAADLNTSAINQMVMTKVAEAVFTDQVVRVRASYAHRLSCLLTALEAHMPSGVSWNEPEGGMFVWVRLPESMDAQALLKEAIETIQVAFVPGHAFFADGTGRNYLRLNFSLPKPAQIEEGMKRLGGLIASKL
ncbi:PLP-dependent aminotransferase family protein [Roseibium sp. CAU 1637]|uniref:PLP-dependent aminotransferase family protein n=1 Tax=Roseibium limicola TaxID=2816037 RepID=A0A939ENZ8_9HYPH|nr:PLP-dependent aminotransferase family protein [Roseibium limicola]MBO0345942.1 PLP-dependent aminotransferase family protein [Roseibium limicola]